MRDFIASLLSGPTGLKKVEILNLIEIPPSSELGDFAFPCFSLSKKLRESPVEIAKDLAEKIKPTREIEKIAATGPYINFFINSKKLAESVIKKIQKKRENYGKLRINEKILIESPGPNTNKPLHIGHARNIILAQSIKNIMEFAGSKARIINIVNDRGVHICKSMLAYEKFGKNQTPEKAKIKSDHFVGDFYVKFSQELSKNPALESEIQECLKKWELGDKKTLAIWKKMNSWALNGFKETYKKFDLKIDKEYFESKFFKEGKDLILEQLKKGNLKQKSDGAIYADLSKENLGEKILLRADKTSIYITQDIYLAILRHKEFNFDKLIYVVANEQEHHFKILFSLLKLFGYSWADKLFHLNYGLVHLESGRMKSREGNVVDSDDLIENLESLAGKEIESRHKDLQEKEKKLRAKAIAMSSLRYYFLKIDRIKDMVFKPEESINFEGNTGPYLLYTYARARSVLRKANYDKKKSFQIFNISSLEKSLILQLAIFPDLISRAYKNLAPNILANHVYQIAQIFNESYHTEKIINSKEEQFRLALVDSFTIVLKIALNLLNIKVIEKM